jgi:hypothetical protein
MTTEEFLACCTTHGLTITDIDQLNLGSIIDYLYAYNDIIKQQYGIEDNNQPESDVKVANQADFNSF